METRFEKLLEQAQSGAGTEWISESELLEFNKYLAAHGYGVARMEVARAACGTVNRNFSYGVLPAPLGEDPERWLNHFDPVRSAEYVREQVQFANEDGALFDYKVWAEQP
ncbi:MAG: hypothetical protein AAF667_01190 [Pseudomonadota bacterium]